MLFRGRLTLNSPLKCWETLSLAEFDVGVFDTIIIFLRSKDVFKHGQIFPKNKFVGATSSFHINLATAFFNITSILNRSKKRLATLSLRKAARYRGDT